MRVYIVIEEIDLGYHIKAVFKEKEQAEKYLNQLIKESPFTRHGYDLEEWYVA